MMIPILTCDSLGCFLFTFFWRILSRKRCFFHFLREISCTHFGNFIKLNWLWYLVLFFGCQGCLSFLGFFFRYLLYLACLLSISLSEYFLSIYLQNPCHLHCINFILCYFLFFVVSQCFFKNERERKKKSESRKKNYTHKSWARSPQHFTQKVVSRDSVWEKE